MSQLGGLRSEVSNMRAVLGEILVTKGVDVIPLPGTDLVLRKTCSESTKVVTPKVLIRAFESVVKRSQGLQTTALDFSLVVQQELRDSITTRRTYGDVLLAGSKQATRKARAVDELKRGTFTVDDQEHLQLCLELNQRKEQMSELVGKSSEIDRAQHSRAVQSLPQGGACANLPTNNNAMPAKENARSKQLVHEPECERSNDRPQIPQFRTPTTRRKRFTIKLSDALMLVEAVCTAILADIPMVPTWDDALAERLRELVVAELDK